MSGDIPFETLDPLLPIDFFSMGIDLPYAKDTAKKFLRQGFQLPDMSHHLGEEKFADVSLFWNEEGLLGEVDVQKPFEHSSFPEYSQGDSIELFIDTRDRKVAGFATRFCHHFVFLATPVLGIQAEEMTRFRSEDSHALCDPSQITVSVAYGKKDYQLKYFIPSSCLHGYDPQTFPRLGLTYKINRYKGPSQHFSVSSIYFDIMQHPSLWSHLHLVNT